MSIFPRNGRTPGVNNSGVPLAITPAQGCEALYYDETCAQKIDPAAINRLISEIVSVINACPSIQYDCARSDNLLRALQCATASNTCELIQAQTFVYTGANQTYTPHVDCTYAIFLVWGAGGGGGSNAGNVGQVYGGAGGFVSGGILTPTGPYTVVVGRAGTKEDTTGGYGGGGPGGNGSRALGSSGGGYSGVFNGAILQNNALVVAGGGGGGGSTYANTAGYPIHAGPGGGLVGGAGQLDHAGVTQYGGQGGTQSAGGAAGAIVPGIHVIGTAGSALQGGAGCNVSGIALGDGSGGGGGGWFGGGGGGNNDTNDGSNDHPGGGGSSYAAPGIIGFLTLAGVWDVAPNSGHPNYAAGIAQGGQGLANSGSGGNGRVVVLEYKGNCP